MLKQLTVTTPSDREIHMTRDFDAPRQLVWDAMTKPELLKKWCFGPPGWSMTKCENDLRVGGRYVWEWSNAEGEVAMRMTGVNREYDPPSRSVRTECFEFGCGPQAGEQVVTMELREDGPRTVMTMTLVFPSKEARDGALQSGMADGMNMGYDRLDEILAEK